MQDDSRLTDTDAEAQRVYWEALRALGPEGRARLAMDLTDRARAASMAGIRMRHPDYDERQVRLALARLTLGEKLFREVYGNEQVEP